MAIAIKNPDAPATEAQINYYVALVLKHQVATGMDPAKRPEVETAIKQWCAGKTKGVLSTHIDQRKKVVDALPLPPKHHAAPADLAPGYYADGDTVYVVVISKASGKPYAKRWDVAEGQAKASWVYAPGAAAKISSKGLTALSLEEAKQWGHLHGRCIRCGAHLTDPASVEAGVGPVCAGYWS